MKTAILALLAAGMLLTPVEGFARPGATVVVGAKPFHGGFARKPFHRPAMHRFGHHRSGLHRFAGTAFRGGHFTRSFHGSHRGFGHARHAGFRHAHIQRGFGIPITWLGGSGFYGTYYDPSDYAGIYDPGPARGGNDAPRDGACRSQEVVITDSPDTVVVLRC